MYSILFALNYLDLKFREFVRKIRAKNQPTNEKDVK